MAAVVGPSGKCGRRPRAQFGGNGVSNLRLQIASITCARFLSGFAGAYGKIHCALEATEAKAGFEDEADSAEYR